MTVTFTAKLVEQFAAASHDVNPVHVSPLYARKTPAGECVAHGMLGLLACLPHVDPPAGQNVSSLRLDFRSPLFLDLPYSIRIDLQSPANVRISLLDGSTVAMAGRITFAPGEPPRVPMPALGVAPRQSPRRLTGADLQTLALTQALYSPPADAYNSLLSMLALDVTRWGDPFLVAAITCSYLVGMELPGEGAMFSGLRLKLANTPSSAPFSFTLNPTGFDDRFSLLTSDFTLGSATEPWASGELTAIVRLPIQSQAPAALPGSGRFTGRRAVVIGASRGLGAALALALAAEGCTVIATYAASKAEAESLRDCARDLPGQIHLAQGDAASLDFCASLAESVNNIGGLDLLICSAAPALRTLPIEPAAYTRIRQYVDQGFAMVAAPLAALLPSLEATSGIALVISSEAVQNPPPEWPHYVAMKAAVEALATTAAIAHPNVTFAIARPGAIRTDLVDTPMGRLTAESPHSVARALIDALADADARPGVPVRLL